MRNEYVTYPGVLFGVPGMLLMMTLLIYSAISDKQRAGMQSSEKQDQNKVAAPNPTDGPDAATPSEGDASEDE